MMLITMDGMYNLESMANHSKIMSQIPRSAGVVVVVPNQDISGFALMEMVMS